MIKAEDGSAAAKGEGAPAEQQLVVVLRPLRVQ